MAWTKPGAVSCTTADQVAEPSATAPPAAERSPGDPAEPEAVPEAWATPAAESETVTVSTPEPPAEAWPLAEISPWAPPLSWADPEASAAPAVTNSQADRAIVRAITAIAQTLGLSTIAEGIETLRQCDFIEALGVNEIQGYLIGKPMAPSDLEVLASSFSRPD